MDRKIVSLCSLCASRIVCTSLKRKIIMENNIKVGGWGPNQLDFPFFFEKKTHKFKAPDIA